MIAFVTPRLGVEFYYGALLCICPTQSSIKILHKDCWVPPFDSNFLYGTLLIKWRPFQPSSASSVQQHLCYACYFPSLHCGSNVLAGRTPGQYWGNFRLIMHLTLRFCFLKDQSSEPVECLKMLTSFILSSFMVVFSRKVNSVSLRLT